VPAEYGKAETGRPTTPAHLPEQFIRQTPQQPGREIVANPCNPDRWPVAHSDGLSHEKRRPHPPITTVEPWEGEAGGEMKCKIKQ